MLDIEKYKKLTKLSVDILSDIYDFVEIGKRSIDVENYARSLLEKYDVGSAFYGVKNGKKVYEYVTCISVNDTAVHGVPNDYEFKPGDIVKVDFGIKKYGLFTDHCFSVGLEPVKKQHKLLLKVARDSIYKAAKSVQPQDKVSKVGKIIHKNVLKYGFDVLKDYTGHGIGDSLHKDPEILAFYDPYFDNFFFNPGSVVCIEAQIVEKSDKVFVDKDGWSVKTKDKGYVAMFEYMVYFSKQSSEILTNTYNFPLTK